jgi:hypothetical protein
MDSCSRGGKPREGLATSKPPSCHFTVGISITGFFGLFTWNKQLLCHEQLRATAHQLIEHRTQGMARWPLAKASGHGASASHPIKKLLTTGYTISLSKHALQLIYITLSYNISADPRPTPIAHRGRGRRPACSPAAHSAHMLYSDTPPLRLTQTQHS